VIFAMVKTYLDLGISLIIEHPMDSDEVSRYENLANELGIHISKVQLYTTPELAYQRITERQKDKEDKVPEDRILRNIGLFEKKDGFVQIDTTSREVDEVVVIVSDHFKKYVLSF
jgi:predicted kinase